MFHVQKRIYCFAIANDFTALRLNFVRTFVLSYVSLGSLFFSSPMNICGRERVCFSSRESGIRHECEGREETTRWLRAISSAGRLDAAAPVFKHQMPAEVWSMLRAFLLPSELLPQKFRPRCATRRFLLLLPTAVSQMAKTVLFRKCENTVAQSTVAKSECVRC